MDERGARSVELRVGCEEKSGSGMLPSRTVARRRSHFHAGKLHARGGFPRPPSCAVVLGVVSRSRGSFGFAGEVL